MLKEAQVVTKLDAYTAALYTLRYPSSRIHRQLNVLRGLFEI